MAIAEQFAGLQMDQLIGAPLCATADASIQLANSTADFINRVGFDEGGKARTVAFSYQKRSINEDGTSNLDEMKVDVPMLAIVPIPNLQVDEVNILFDMEVKQSEKQESSLDLGATINGTAKLGVIKISVTGSVSAHKSNTRSSDNSAKYHVDVRATNHGIPEGLARVLDMMAANVAPALIGSTLKDGNGQNLPEQARVRAERLKELRQEIGQIQSRLDAANGSLDNNIQKLKRLGTAQLNIYQDKMTTLMDSLDTDDTSLQEQNQEKAADYTKAMNEVNQSWNAFQNKIADTIKLIVETKAQPNENEVSQKFALKTFNDNGGSKPYDTEEKYYKEIADAQKDAFASQSMVDSIEKELFDKKEEYNKTSARKELTSK